MSRKDGLAIEPVFYAALDTYGMPRPESEHRFHPVRRWRFDYAWPGQRVALEVEGGAFTRGRHTRGAGFKRDAEKYNEATAMGWRILRILPDQLTDQRTLEWLRRTMEQAA